VNPWRTEDVIDLVVMVGAVAVYLGFLLGIWYASRAQQDLLAAAWLKGMKDRPTIDRAIAEYRERTGTRANPVAAVSTKEGR
jgi:hypothetical protein